MVKVRLLVVVAILLNMLAPLSAHAQQGLPPLPTGGRYYFVPFLATNLAGTKGTPYSEPTLGVVEGADLHAASSSSFCAHFLSPQELQAAKVDDVCPTGKFYPGLANKGVIATAVDWNGIDPVSVAGSAQAQPVQVRSEVLVFKGFLFDAQKFEFGTKKKLVAFKLNLNPPEGVTAASVNQLEESKELLWRLNKMDDVSRMRFPFEIPAAFPVYNKMGASIAALAVHCPIYLEGKYSWPWYFTEFATGDWAMLGGIWGSNTYPTPTALSDCMGDYRYFKWYQLVYDEQFESVRGEILADKELGGTLNYEVPEWHDNELGGNWVITMASAAGGALLVGAYYVANGVTTVVSGVWLVVPDEKLKCFLEEGRSVCSIQS